MRAQVEAANTILSKMPNGPGPILKRSWITSRPRTTETDLPRNETVPPAWSSAMRAQQVPAGRKEELAKDFKAKWSDFLKAADELTPSIDKALGEYRKLQDDPSVKDALSAFRRSKKATALLGPSKNLQNVHDMIKNARRNYAPEIAAPKKKPRSSSTPSKATTKKKGQAMKL